MSDLHNTPASHFLSPDCEHWLRRFVYERTGIVIHDHQRETLRQTAAHAAQHFGYANCTAYVEALSAKTEAKREVEFLISGVTIGESYFFRDPGQMEHLRTVWLPDIIRQRREQQHLSLRIWSAGCSSGQEIYSLAIMLHELLPDFARWNLCLMATDINTDSLAAGVRGRYREWSMRATPPHTRARYFTLDDGEFQISSAVAAPVRFSYLNLIDDSFPSILTDTHTMDLILCRNVFIYFDRATTKLVLKKFARSLARGGILMLGPSDTIDDRIDGLELVTDGKAHYYRHPTLAAYAPVATPAPAHLARVGEYEQTKPRQPTAAAGVPAAKQSADSSGVIALLTESRWTEAAERAEQCLLVDGAQSDMCTHLATALANLGQTERALQLAEQAVSLDPINKHAAFIQGLVLLELNQTAAAEAALRRVIFLDNGFLEAHYQLGQLLLRSGRHKPGIKSLQNALAIAAQGAPDRHLHGAPGMSMERLCELLKNEISMYQAGNKGKSQ